MDTNKLYNIENGPSVTKLIDAFKYAYDSTVKVELRFLVPCGYTMDPKDPRAAFIGLDMQDIRINAIQHEDGSGVSFNFSGYCQAKEAWAREFKDYRFGAYYDARTRKGTIRFRPDPAG